MTPAGTSGADTVEHIPLGAVPTGACIAVAGGRVLLSRVGDEVVAYANACLHRGAAMEDGFVRGGTLTCPAHLWRYRLRDGACVTGPGQLTPVPVTVDGDTVEVVVPDPTRDDADAEAGAGGSAAAAGEGGATDAAGEGTSAMRARLLAHARTWSRDA